MSITIEQLSAYLTVVRKKDGLSQEVIAKNIGVNRTAIAFLEQERRLPTKENMEKICKHLDIPIAEWASLYDRKFQLCNRFEYLVSELTGTSVSLDKLDEQSSESAREAVDSLFGKGKDDEQARAVLNSVLVYFGCQTITKEFYLRFLTGAFNSIENFERSIHEYQKTAIRIFCTFAEAYRELNSGNVENPLKCIEPRSLSEFESRAVWSGVEQIESSALQRLGYISAQTAQEEQAEREELKSFLQELAEKVEKEGALTVQSYPTKTKAKIDSLLRKFDSTFRHGVFSSLFSEQPDEIRREAERLCPTAPEYDQIRNLQAIGLRNLAAYVAADFIDVYVATSMRTTGDYVAADMFCRSVFAHNEIKTLNIRYFNPTQAWIDDRVAKGLVEALMLKRALVTIYMAQKSDTFGKDAEASVALGHGKTVIVYVPKLAWRDFDVESFSQRSASELRNELKKYANEIESGADWQVIVSHLIKEFIEGLSKSEFVDLVRSIWADFDLPSEDARIVYDNLNLTQERRRKFKEWINAIASGGTVSDPDDWLVGEVTKMIVALSMVFERRAKIFKDVHPLAIQVIVQSGVLNGIVVVRSVDETVAMLRAVLSNTFDFELIFDEKNYQLLEKRTRSAVRVIPRHRLIRHAFDAYFNKS